MLGAARGQSAVRDGLRVLGKHAPVNVPRPQACWVPPLRTTLLFKAVLLSVVCCPDNRGARRYILVSRLAGKRQGEEMSAFGYQWKWKNLNNKKKKKSRGTENIFW